MKYRLLLVSLTTAFTALSYAQGSLEKALGSYFTSYHANGQLIRNKMKLDRVVQNDSLHTIQVTANAAFGEQTFTPEKAWYNTAIRRLMP